jgi:hypothetical protein
LPNADAVIQLEFGLRSLTPRQWTGEITATGAEVLSISGWHFIYPDRIIGNRGWDFTTRLLRGDPRNTYSELIKPPAALLPNGVIAVIKSSGAAEFSVTTNDGAFSFDLAELKAAGRLIFLGGEASAVYTPPARPLTQGLASQHDFPSVAVSGGRTFVAWVTYQNEANLVYLAEREHEHWTVRPASDHWGDYYGSAVATDGVGRAHVVWSEYKEDRWRLVSRVYDPATGKWAAEQYVAPNGRRQMFQTMATDSRGAPWIAWQEYRNGNFDVFAAFAKSEGWSAPIQISESPANDWSPAIAAASDGTIYVAWDSYDAGNYDIFLRAIHEGKPGPIIRVTRDKAFHAHVSIAVDAQDRVWLAWDESGANWGKDIGVITNNGYFGTSQTSAATALHESRSIRLVRYANGVFVEPSQPLQQSLPAWLSGLNEYPVVVIGPGDLPYVFFRHYLNRFPVTEDERRLQIGSQSQVLAPWAAGTWRMLWDVYMTGFDGARWLPARELPGSTGRCYMQSGAAIRGQALLYFWGVDGRTYADPRERSAQLRYAEFSAHVPPAGVEHMRPFQSEPAPAPEAQSSEQRGLARVRAARWPGAAALRLFRGDLHRHTDMSGDGTWDPDILDAYRYALDAAALDFLAVTDHSFAERTNYYHYDWWRTRQVATLFENPGHFVTFFAYERTVGYPGGHRNIISLRPDAQPFRISDEEFSGVESYGTRLFPYLKQRGDIAIPHSTAGGTDFRENDPIAEPLVEVFQGLRGSYEEPNAPARVRHRILPDGFVWAAWAKGLHLGLIASSDHQSTHESFACVWAPALTREAILDALKTRHTFGATDAIVMRFQATDRDRRRFLMGEEVRSDSSPEFRIDVQGTASLKHIEFIRNDRILTTRSSGDPEWAFTYRDFDRPRGSNYYHVRLVQQDGNIAWSSPIWVTVR